MKTVKVLTIAGSDPSGGAGVQADLKTITVLGGFGMSVITALTAQNSLGVMGICEVTPDFVRMQFEAVLTDMGVDAAKTGMLGGIDVLRTVAADIRKYRIEKVVVDPVMLAKDGSPLLRGDFKEIMIQDLIPAAFVVTPNIPEAEVLTGISIASVRDMEKAAKIIFGFGARHVVVKGGHHTGDAVDVLYDGKEIQLFSSPRIDQKAVHGTGCAFSAAIATFLASGKTVHESVMSAKDYIAECIKHSFRVGNGSRMINHSVAISKTFDEGAAG